MTLASGGVRTPPPTLRQPTAPTLTLFQPAMAARWTVLRYDEAGRRIAGLGGQPSGAAIAYRSLALGAQVGQPESELCRLDRSMLTGRQAHGAPCNTGDLCCEPCPARKYDTRAVYKRSCETRRVSMVTPPRGRPPAMPAAPRQKCTHMLNWISLATRSRL